jgi:hypothetical protein
MVGFHGRPLLTPEAVNNITASHAVECIEVGAGATVPDLRDSVIVIVEGEIEIYARGSDHKLATRTFPIKKRTRAFQSDTLA